MRGPVRGPGHRIISAPRVPSLQWPVSSVQLACTVRGAVLLQGNQEVMLSQLEEAAQSEHANPDRYLDRLSTEFAEKLGEWASNASGLYTGPGCFAAGQDRLEGIVIVPDKTSDLSGS